MTQHIKYTKELLETAVKNSTSFAGVLRYLGLKWAGGTQSHITKKIKSLNIDTSHFLGKGYLKGIPSIRRKHYSNILIKRENGKRELAVRLRRSLIECGIEYKCSECSQRELWNGKELRLQVDHINRDYLDNRKENLRFLCPNCHSQTDGFCGSKGKTSIIKQETANNKKLRRLDGKNIIETTAAKTEERF